MSKDLLGINGPNNLHCSFCGKHQLYVERLIAGPGVYICDECVELCNEILDDESPKASEPTEIPSEAEADQGVSNLEPL